MLRMLLRRIAWLALLAASWGTASGGETRELAVFTFDNLTGSDKHAWVGAAFAESLSTKLACLDRIRTRSRREIADLLRVHTIAPVDLQPTAADRIGGLVRCDLLVFGAVQAAGPVDAPRTPLRVTARLVDVRTGLIGEAVQVDGEMGRLLDLQTRMALAFAARLDPEISLSERVGMAENGTEDLAAYKACSEGLRLLDAEKFVEAIAQFREAMALHPGILYGDAHHALGLTFLRSGREAEMLSEFSGDVARLTPIWFRLGQASARAGQRKQAIEALRTFVQYTAHRHTPWQYDCAGGRSRLIPGSGDHLALLDEERRLQLLDGTSGRLLWSLPDSAAVGPVAPGGGLVCYATGERRLLCRVLHTKAVRWSIRTDAAITSGPVLCEREGVCLYALASGALVCADLADGTTRWTKRAESPPARLGALPGTALRADAAGNLLARSLLDGRRLWQASLSMPAMHMLAGPDAALVLDRAGTLHCLASSDGRALWQQVGLDAKGCRPITFEDRVVLPTAEALVAKDRQGRTLWSRTDLAGTRYLASGGSRIAVSIDGRSIQLLDPATGETDAVRRLPHRLRALHGQGERVLALLKNGSLLALGMPGTAHAPSDLDGYLLLAKTLLEDGHADEARQTYRIILDRVEPASLEAAQGLLSACERLGTPGTIAAARKTLKAIEAEHHE